MRGEKQRRRKVGQKQVVKEFFILIMLGYQNFKSRSRASSSSSGSDKILKPEKIEKIIRKQLHQKDLFQRLLEDCEMIDEEEPAPNQIQATIANLNLSPRSHQHSGCKCTKIDCLKLYCECFAKGRICGESCSCVCCHNTLGNQQEILKAKSIVNYRQPGYFQGVPSYVPARKCTCKKSLCRKKYCECYNAGMKCTQDCECCDCHNGKPEISMGFDSRIQIEVR